MRKLWNWVRRWFGCGCVQTAHQARVEAFMRRAGQAVPGSPGLPGEEVRALRARLILEEAFETVEALGVTAYWHGCPVYYSNLNLSANLVPDLDEIVDGCADLSVVAMGTLSACGVKDDGVLRLVDENNLAKFGPGHQVVNGKLVEPPGHVPPDIGGEIERQRNLVRQK
jgi:predicted HAD superfamily Cof-like phosphohydrolase